MQFFTATCLNCQNLLEPEEHKKIIMDSLQFMVTQKRIWLYGFVIMPNHIHLLWSQHDEYHGNIQQTFLKYTAQQIKFSLQDKGDLEQLEKYRSTQQDREFHFWERRPFRATMYNRKVAEQKLDYIHYNPVKKGWCELPEHYTYSSAKYYILNEDKWG